MPKIPKHIRKGDYLGGFIQDLPEQKAKNWIFGAKDRPIINASGDYNKYLPNPELQATKYFDPYSCVSESAESQVSIRLNLMMEEDPAVRTILDFLGCLDENGKCNFSGRFIAVGSGTVPGRGNSQYAVYEFIRKNGLVGEKHWPSNFNMDQEEYFAEFTPEVKALGLKFLEYFNFEYEDVGETNAELKEALKRSPLTVVVGGTVYGMNLYRPQSPVVNYNHQVINFNQLRNYNYFNEVIPTIHEIFDTYDPFIKKYAGNYPFAFAKAVYLSKKKIPMLYKKTGQPAICFKHWSEDCLIAFADGSIPGGDLFKSLFGVTNYSELPIQSVPEWPFPIKYLLATTGLVPKIE